MEGTEAGRSQLRSNTINIESNRFIFLEGQLKNPVCLRLDRTRSVRAAHSIHCLGVAAAFYIEKPLPVGTQRIYINNCISHTIPSVQH